MTEALPLNDEAFVERLNVVLVVVCAGFLNRQKSYLGFFMVSQRRPLPELA